MEMIDLFDKYIKNQLSEKGLSDFNETLKSDKDFAEEFQTYLLCVDGIIKEAQQDDIEFAHAIKSLSKAELMNIIGKKVKIQDLNKIKVASASIRASAMKPKNWDNFGDNEENVNSSLRAKSSKKSFRINKWILVAACYGLVIGGGAIWIAKAYRDAGYTVDNAIYACADIYTGGTRDALGMPDITKLNDKELKDKLPRVKEIFRNSHSPENIYDSGNTLAIAYLRLHDRNKAKEIFHEIVLKLTPYDDFSEEILQIESILKVLD